MAANQLALGPVVLTSVFAWNLALTRQLSALPGKIQRDLPPTIVNGWKFWVPASGINFALVPLQFQARLSIGLCGSCLIPTLSRHFVRDHHSGLKCQKLEEWVHDSEVPIVAQQRRGVYKFHRALARAHTLEYLLRALSLLA